MVNYKCKVCNYSTDRKSSIDKHNNSEKHDEKINSQMQPEKVHQIPNNILDVPMYPDTSDTSDSLLITKYKCEYCYKEFAYHSGLYRHKKNRCSILKQTISIKEDVISKDIDIEFEKDTKIKELEMEKKDMQIEFHQKELKDKENQIKDKENQIKELKEYIKNTKPSNTTYNISVKNYVQKNYANAPALKKLDDYNFIKYDDKLLDTIGYQYRNKILDKYLGDFLIGFYKKEDPAEQAIWNSDASRLTYIIKELLTNNKSCWNTDPKGVRTKNYIIDPLLIFLKNIINDYSINFSNTILDKKIDEITQLLDNLHSLTLLVKDINNNLMSDDIVKYIAPYFSLDKIPELLKK